MKQSTIYASLGYSKEAFDKFLQTIEIDLDDISLPANKVEAVYQKALDNDELDIALAAAIYMDQRDAESD